MTGRKPWKVAVAGCGAAAFGLHLPLLQTHRAFDVIAVTDRDPRRAAAASLRFDIPAVATSTQELLNDIDLLVVLTGVHDTLISEALDADIHAFTEKPVSLDPDRTLALRKQAQAAGLILEVGAMRAHDPALHALLASVPDVRSGWLTKVDGRDAIARRALLPDWFEPYTFADDPPQPIPPGLTSRQLRALQILLWQGYHLLTALTLAVDTPQPVGCTTNDDQTLHATISGSDGQLFTVIVGPAPDGVFSEQIHLTGGHHAATLDFAPPYEPASATRLTTHAPGSSQSTGFADPFASMWDAADRRLADEATPSDIDSADLAERVERLALALARTTDPASALYAQHGTGEVNDDARA